MAENIRDDVREICFGTGEINVDKRMWLIQKIEDQYLGLAAEWLKTASVTADNVVLANDVMRILDRIRRDNSPIGKYPSARP